MSPSVAAVVSACKANQLRVAQYENLQLADQDLIMFPQTTTTKKRKMSEVNAIGNHQIAVSGNVSRYKQKTGRGSILGKAADPNPPPKRTKNKKK